MDSETYVLDWVDKSFKGTEFKDGFVEWLRRTFNIGDATLDKDVIEVAHLFLISGWLERRLFSQMLGKFDLTIPQFFTLLTIYHAGDGCTMGVLAERTHQCSATMTGIVDRLLKMNMVERRRDDGDRRQVLVQLTPNGKDILKETVQKRFESLRRFLLEFDDAGRQQFVHALRNSTALMEAELKEQDATASLEPPESSLC